MEYYFGEHLRWNLGWETPNQAGAFLATLLPWLWALIALAWSRRGHKKRLARTTWWLLAAVAFALEAVGSYALAHTYSRGAIVGLFGGAIGWLLLARRNRQAADSPVLKKLAWTPWLARIALWVVCLTVTGFHDRLSPEHVAEDRSSLNRLVLWKGGAALIAASPMHGWGWDNSGAAFMNWTQPIERKEGYLSMVNSYLTVAVEAGLPLFSLLLAMMLLPLGRFSVGRAISSDESLSFMQAVQLGAAAAWITWMGCLVFSNLWIFPKLWIAPTLGALLLLVLWPHRLRLWRTALLRSATLALVSSLLLLIAGHYFASKLGVRFSRIAPGVVDIWIPGRLDAAGASTIAVVPDIAVFGESPGQEMRRWLLADPRLRILRSIATTEQLTAERLADCSTVLLAGESSRAMASLELSSSPTELWIVHPSVPPPDGVFSESAVPTHLLLPGIDISGQNPAWWSWATQTTPTTPVILSDGLALDLRPRWPGIALDWPLKTTPPVQ